MHERQFLRHARTYDGARVLVTGGAGAIGSNLSTALLELGAEVFVLDDLRSGVAWNLSDDSRLRFLEGDILDDHALGEAFEWQPNVVFHLAAFFANQNSIDHPEADLAVNGSGTLRVLERCAATKVDRLVFASSSSIYGTEPTLPVDEEAISIDLTTPYQVTKLLGEMYCIYYQKQLGLPTVRTRFFNSYGPGEVPGRYRNVIPNFTYWAMCGEPLPITGNPDATRDFTYVGDLVDGLLACGYTEAAVGEAFNLATGREVTIIDIARAICERTQSTSSVIEAARRTWDTKSRMWGSNAKARRLLGFDPTTSLSDGLDATVAWFADHWAQIEQDAAF